MVNSPMDFESRLALCESPADYERQAKLAESALAKFRKFEHGSSVDGVKFKDCAERFRAMANIYRRVKK